MPLYRSLLFAPGNVPRRVEKAFTLQADVVIVDLEDSVALSDKEATRKPVAEALARPRKGRGYVRVNAPSSPFCYGDLVATIHKGVDGVLLPKVESAADLHAIDWLLAALERERGLQEGSIDLVPQVETAAGVQRVDRILQARSLRPYKAPWRVRRVAFGAADYANELGLTVHVDEARARRRPRAHRALVAGGGPRRPDRQSVVRFQGQRRVRARSGAQPPRRLPGPPVRAPGSDRAREPRVPAERSGARARRNASSRPSRKPKRAARPPSRSTAR